VTAQTIDSQGNVELCSVQVDVTDVPENVVLPAQIEVADVEGDVSQNAFVEVSRSLERSYSTSAIDTLKAFDAAEEAALAEIDARIEKEIKFRNDQAIFEAELSVVAARVPTPHRVQSPVQSLDSTEQKSPATSATSITTEAERQSESYAEHLAKLAEAERYAEIPAVFEGMLVANIQPTPVAYNALLNAAIKLPAEKDQVIPKALDVYTDMMRRKVSPNTATYSTLINLLASRSIEVSSLKKSLEEKRVRYGGMEEAGKFMFASNEIEYAILSEDDRLDLAIRLFEGSIAYHTDRSYTPQIYHKLIAACAEAGRVPEMARFYEHMKTSKTIPLSATFPAIIKAHTQTGALDTAVKCYNEYKALAVAHDKGELTMTDREDALVYASVIAAYVNSDKISGAIQFYNRIVESQTTPITFKDTLIYHGFVTSLVNQKKFSEAMDWIPKLEYGTQQIGYCYAATVAADNGYKMVGLSAFAMIDPTFEGLPVPTTALLACLIREGDALAAQHYFGILEESGKWLVSKSYIEPTAMLAVALIGSGQVAEGLNMFDQMLARIKATEGPSEVNLELEEAIDFILRFMADRSITDPRVVYHPHTSSPALYQQAAPTPAYEDTFDPYADSTDFKGSAIIGELIDRVERGPYRHNGRVSNKLEDALNRFRNIRRLNRHPRYITYAKLINAAAGEKKWALVNEIYAMAQHDVPLLPQYAIVRYGWVSIFDAMVGACLNLGHRDMAGQYHQELLNIGAAPTANTFGLYITTMKETKTFDEASEAVNIFMRARSEGVEPSSFLYNALIGKLGKARRIDDCLSYFAEMRQLGIRPTSVTYGTVVNALLRVSDEKFAVELFEEMEQMPNYNARTAPYNSMIQFYLNTKQEKAKVLEYYERMKSKRIPPTDHTYKLLIDTHATLEPINMAAAEAVLDVIRSTGQKPVAVHYASLIHAKGCVTHDMDAARAVFDSVIADRSIMPEACLYQALFESMVANHRIADSEPVLRAMSQNHVRMTPYIANTLIKGWANEAKIDKAKAVFAALGMEHREPSTYEAMTRALLSVQDREGAEYIVEEMKGRGYPAAVANKTIDLLAGGHSDITI
jgi:pentatricopeptide repeat protein